MAVKVTVIGSDEEFTGKFATIEGDTLSLFSGIMADKKGGFRGCGKKRTFTAATVMVVADNPATELKQR